MMIDDGMFMIYCKIIARLLKRDVDDDELAEQQSMKPTCMRLLCPCQRIVVLLKHCDWHAQLMVER